MTLIKNTYWSAKAAIVLSMGRFFLTIFLAKNLNLADYGEFVFLQWVIDMACLLCAFGLPGVASRFYSQYENNSVGKVINFHEWFKKYSAMAIFVSMIGTCTLMYFFYEKTFLFSLLVSLWASVSLWWALLIGSAQGMKRFDILAISNTIYVSIIILGFSIIFLTNIQLNIEICILLLIFSTLNSILCIKKNQKKYNIYNKEVDYVNFREIRFYSLNLWLTGIVSGVIWSRGEIIFIKSELNLTQLAIYSAALTLTALASQGMMLLTGALGPQISGLWGANKKEEAFSICTQMTDVLSLFSAIFVSFLIGFSPEIIKYSFGARFEEAVDILAITSFGVLGLASAASSNQLVSLKTNGKFGLYINLFGVIIFSIIGIPLVKLMGLYGAGLLRVVVQNGIGLYSIYYANKLFNNNLVNIKNQLLIYILLVTYLILSNFLYDFNLIIRFVFYILLIISLFFLIRSKNNEKIFILIKNKIIEMYRNVS